MSLLIENIEELALRGQNYANYIINEKKRDSSFDGQKYWRSVKDNLSKKKIGEWILTDQKKQILTNAIENAETENKNTDNGQLHYLFQHLNLTNRPASEKIIVQLAMNQTLFTVNPENLIDMKIYYGMNYDKLTTFVIINLHSDV